MATKEQKEILEKTRKFVKDKCYGEGSGHDWFHIERVTKLALYIAGEEQKINDKRISLNLYIIEMAALLHDIDDWKFSDNTSTTEKFLEEVSVKQNDKEWILEIIKKISFKAGIGDSKESTIEGQIVQDADRIDAMGAIGIARTFTYGGSKGRLMYDPSIKPVEKYESLEKAKNSENHTINHFYEKLLKLKNLMNTKTGKKLAEERHGYMEDFLTHFFSEWNVDL